MTPSDKVRAFVHENYIVQARQSNKSTVQVCAGDIHRALGFSQRSALVCGALGSLKFQDEYNVKLLSREGPGVGMTTRFTFRV